MSLSPVSKTEKEKHKLIQEKCQTILAAMLRDEDNKYCVDCDAKGPRWASWNLGIFLCIRCAGIHRNLGVHISRVKSVNLDSWTPEQVVTLQQMGNSRARAVYEANLPDNFRRPQTDSTLESFIRAKYETKKYIAREWVQPPPVKVSWDAEIELEMKRKKEAKRKTNGSPAGTSVELSVSASTTRSRPTEASHSTNPSITGTKEPNQPIEVSLPPPSKPSSAAQDLLGLDSVMDIPSTINLFGCSSSGIESIGAGITTAPSTVTAISKDSEEDDFFNQKTPCAVEKRTLDKNSILALYNQGSTTSSSIQPNIFAPLAGFGSVPQSAPLGQNNMMNSGLSSLNPVINPIGVMPGVGAIPSAYGNPNIQSTMYSSPMYPAPGQISGVNQLSQQLNGLSFSNPTNPMLANPSPANPGMLVNRTSTAMQMNTGVMPGMTNNPYLFMSSDAPSTSKQQPKTLSTNLWQ